MPAQAGPRVLLVEDDPLSQEVACGMLAALGLAVDIAGDGAEALRRAAAAVPDLVLMDVQMPVMDGLTAARAMRSDPALADLPIIAMSANAFPEDRRRCLEAGMDGHIPKPVDPARLREELARWLPIEASAPGDASPPLPAPGPAPAIDVATGLRYFGGREDAYHRMLGRFAALRASDASSVRAALSSGDPLAASRLAHSLKSMAATLGAETLRSASARVEALIGEGDARAVESALLALETALEAACADMTCILSAAGAVDHSRSAG